MTRLATQRLIDASAALEPADRALLSLLINHGLDDEALARMMNASPEAIASRREQLVQRLGAPLGLPPESILAALEELAGAGGGQAGADQPSPAGPEPPDAGHPANGGAPLSAPSAPAPTAHRTPSRSGPWRRRAAALVVLLVAAIALVIAVSSGTTKRSPKAASKVRETAPAPATGVAPAPRSASSAHHTALASLPGGPAAVGGSVTLLGRPGRPRLALSTTGLPAPGQSHYELWLYNSIIDSVPLARLRAPNDTVTVALPARYRHYRWLDISLQPPGTVNHSGASMLRAPLPR